MLQDIIANTTKQPTIVNEQSKFVIVTYWWGRGNLNGNTARPCVSFYENFIQKIIKTSINMFNSVDKKQIPVIFESFDNDIMSLPTITKIIDNYSNSYSNMVYEYAHITSNEVSKDDKTLVVLEKLKAQGKTPTEYEYKNTEMVSKLLTIIVQQIIKLNKTNIFKLFAINDQIQTIKKQFFDIKNTLDEATTKDIKRQIESLTKQKTDIQALSKKNLTTKQTYSGLDEFYQNKSIYEILNAELRFLNPIKFEEMIQLWEAKCTEHKCNYLVVEYPEFAKPGGYQLAINAKPLFIQKSIQLCPNRGVLYIDGDMFIRKYPAIFDTPDVDFMARGWWIDPRSSYKMEESIVYDPYTFETSGGTMFFSQSPQSKMLINKWVEQSAKSFQQGKADDRILSLVFNTYKLLCSMKIIQLPIEYLWLSLDYDERMMESVYDYDEHKMKESIFIEHPECLTSEDTATGAGASNDRTPMFYSFIEENLSPVSEEMHEYIMFPNKELTKSFESYFNYMKNIQYMNDGNPELIKKGFVDVEHPENNESPLYVIDYDDKFGNKKYPDDPSYTINQIAEINMSRATKMNIASLSLMNNTELGATEIQNINGSLDDAKIISLVIRLLQDGKTVIYNPIKKLDYDSEYYAVLKDKLQNQYSYIEFGFVPIFNEKFVYNDFFKPNINVNQPMFFRPNDILIKFLSMFLSFQNLSEYLNNGSYEFNSRVRIGYLLKPNKNKLITGGKHKRFSVASLKVASLKGGESSNLDKCIEEYNNGLDLLKPTQVTGGKRRYTRKRPKSRVTIKRKIVRSKRYTKKK